MIHRILTEFYSSTKIEDALLLLVEKSSKYSDFVYLNKLTWEDSLERTGTLKYVSWYILGEYYNKNSLWQPDIKKDCQYADGLENLITLQNSSAEDGQNLMQKVIVNNLDHKNFRMNLYQIALKILKETPIEWESITRLLMVMADFNESHKF